MKTETKSKIKIGKEELLEKLGLTGKVTFIQYDWKNQELIIEGEFDKQDDEQGWFSFG